MSKLPRDRLLGTPQLPGDKSISHRYAMLAAAGSGDSRLINFSSSQDCKSTLRCLRQLGVEIRELEEYTEIAGRGRASWRAPATPLDCGNSGTAMRLLSGLSAGLAFPVSLLGDSSLSRRPMERICQPLRQMGAKISAAPGDRPPLTFQGGSQLSAIRYRTPVASAQVKSCLLLAGLNADGTTRIQEPSPSRDHTERALPWFGIELDTADEWIRLRPGSLNNPAELHIPGDLSAATFFIVGALLAPGSRIRLESVGINSTRSAFLELLEASGAPISTHNSRRFQGEPVGDLEIHFAAEWWQGFPNSLRGADIPNLIDEIPALAVLGTQMRNGLTVLDAAELRAKECDRIQAIVRNLQTLGAEARELEDGFHVPFTPRLTGGSIQTYGDHRIAMAFWLANLVSESRVELDDPDCVAISDPGFFQELEKVRRNACD